MTSNFANIGPPSNFFGSRVHKMAGTYVNFAVATITAGTGGNPPVVPTDPWVANNFATFAAAMPSAKFTDYAAAGGFTGFRLVIDPGPLLLAYGNPTRIAYLTATITAAVDLVLSYGMTCLVDMHVRPNPQVPGYGLSSTEICQAAPSGAFWTTYVATVAALAKVLDARYALSRGRVALEVFNEPPLYGSNGGYQTWATSLFALYTAIRAGAPGITLFMAGDNYAQIGTPGGSSAIGLLAINPSLYDSNCMWVFHDYVYVAFTFQCENGVGAVSPGPNGYICGLTYPPQNHPGGVSAAIASATAYINADSSKTGAQQSALITAATTTLNYYFNTPYDFNKMKSDTYGNLAVANWADSYGIARNRIFMGEFGVDDGTINPYISGTSGASQASKAAYLRDKRMTAEYYGFSWSVWSYQGIYNGIHITDTNTGLIVPAYAAALFAP